nr:hypothetical protein [uncultured Oscillibacter sp.]
MGVLDEAGLRHLWDRVKGLVGIPIKRSLTLEEYKALSEAEKTANVVYIITDDNGGVVENFNGRAGAVSPQEGDYSADMISGLSEALAAKQDTLSGSAGQMVGFDEEGRAVPQDMPSGEDCLPLTGGTMTGAITASSYDPILKRTFTDKGLAGKISIWSLANNYGQRETNLEVRLGALGDAFVSAGSKLPTRLEGVASPADFYDAANKQYVDNKVRNAIWDGLYEPEGATFNIPGVFDGEPLVYEYQVGGLGVALAYVLFDEAHPANGTLSGSVQFNNIYASESSGRVEGLCFYQTSQGYHSMSYLTCTDGEDAFSFRVSVPANAVDGGELFILAFGNYK